MEVENLVFNIKRTGDTAAKGTDRLGSSLRRLRNASNSASKGLGAFLKSISRMGKIMLLRQAIRALIKAMHEGLKSAYMFNSIAGGEMSAALDALKSASVQATGAIGSAFGELLATLSPILISLLNLITQVANGIAQLFAVLGGRSTYTKAIASSEKWAKATEKGSKAAKEWKNQLMGFDEINRLEEPSDTSGSGGGSAPYEGGFELAPAFNEWASQLRKITLDWWHSLDLEPITKSFERLKTAVMDFVSIVDDALYWAYTEVLLPFGKWAIEKAFPASLELVASMFEALNATLRVLSPLFLNLWNNILKPIASFLGEVFIAAIQWLTRQFEQLTQKIQESKNLGEFIKSLEPGEAILVSLATAITGVATAFAAWRAITSVVNSVSSVIGLLSNPVGQAIVIIGALVFAGIALYQNWDTIKAKALEIWEVVKETWGNIKKWIADKIEGIVEWFENFNRKVDECIGQPIKKAIDTVKTKVDEMKQKFEDTFAGTFIGNLLGFKKEVTDTHESVSGEISGMASDTESSMSAFGQSLDNARMKIFDVYNDSSVLGSIASAFENLASRAHAALQDIITGLGHVIGHCMDALKGLNAVANKRAAQNEADGSQYLQGFAVGGFPDEGQLFMARENGVPEMVGTIGGRAAVANNDQIVQGISNGVYNAVVSAMSLVSNGHNSSTPVDIYLDGKLIARSTTQYQKQFARAGTM